jgi:hypothetical protein
MAHIHRLHTDHEGMRQRGENEQGRGDAANCRLTPCEVQRVSNQRGCVERERNEVHGVREMVGP